MQVKSSSNYNQFKTFDFNRPTSAKRKDLSQSLADYGWIQPVICVETDIYGEKGLYVLDGEHRILQAKHLNLGVKYVILSKDITPTTKSGLVQLCARLNASSKKWSIDEYVEAFVKCGYKDYKYLMDKKANTSISYGTIANIYTNVMDHHNPIALKEGTFSIPKEYKKRGDTIINYINTLCNVTKFYTKHALGFTHFYTNLDNPKKFNVKVFAKALENNLDLFEDMSDYMHYSTRFQKIYNEIPCK